MEVVDRLLGYLKWLLGSARVVMMVAMLAARLIMSVAVVVARL